MDYYKYISNIYGLNHFEADKAIRDIVKYYLGRDFDLNELGEYAGTVLYEAADYIDKIARPHLLTWGINGDRVDRVWLSPIERMVLRDLIKRFGILKYAYRGGSWLEHYASIYLVSDPGIACILTVTNQTAYAIYKYGGEDVSKFFEGLIGEGDLLFGATWFTEIQGGSDLGANETRAWMEGGKWYLEGDKKYFASNAGLADLALVSARPEGARLGAKGLALYLVPRLRDDGELNYFVRRIKWKSATVSVPTGEVEFNHSLAYLIGDVDKGIYYIMENLMLARLANAVGAIGIAGKSILESKEYIKKRSAFGKKLIDHPLIQRDIYLMDLLHRAGMIITFKAIKQFDIAWSSRPPYNADYHYARLLTHIVKNYTAEYASDITKMAMEIHGGIGFLSEFPIERWHREALITPIWEGTSNIHALDLLEVMYKKNAHKTLLEDFDGIIRGEAGYIRDAYRHMIELFSKAERLDEYSVQIYAKDMLMELGDSISSILLSVMGGETGLEEYIELGESLYKYKILKHPFYSVFSRRLVKRILE